MLNLCVSVLTFKNVQDILTAIAHPPIMYLKHRLNENIVLLLTSKGNRNPSDQETNLRSVERIAGNPNCQNDSPVINSDRDVKSSN